LHGDQFEFDVLASYDGQAAAGDLVYFDDHLLADVLYELGDDQVLLDQVLMDVQF
jgi:hypothetical protein